MKYRIWFEHEYLGSYTVESEASDLYTLVGRINRGDITRTDELTGDEITVYESMISQIDII